MHKILCILALFIFSVFLYPAEVIFATDDSSTPAPRLIISEVKLGDGEEITFSDGTKARDFVTLYNTGPESVSLSGWKLEYVKSDFLSQNCSGVWSDTSTTRNLSGSVGSREFITVKRTLNDGADGSLRLIDSLSAIHDLVGWGLSAPCYESAKTLTPPDGSGKSIQRYLDCDLEVPIDSDNNADDFRLSDTPGVFINNCPPVESPGEDPGEGGLGSGPLPDSSCQGVVINEILANPAGSDDGKEFIELYNPTNHGMHLEGCSLQTSANSKLYIFGNVNLNSGEFRSFNSTETGLILPNSSGGIVYLLDADNSELQEVPYPADLDDDVSWSLINGVWARTFALTPGAVNQLLSLKPCPDGHYRSPETNRCLNTPLDLANITACKPGQERNPETNRCRNIASLANVLKACGPDQYRNPETNRCKNTDSANSLAPCKPGQERNPETNRCRNVLSSLEPNVNDGIQDVKVENSADQLSMWLAVGSIFGAVVYGVWEWRNDIFLQYLNLKNRLFGGA